MEIAILLVTQQMIGSFDDPEDRANRLQFQFLLSGIQQLHEAPILVHLERTEIEHRKEILLVRHQDGGLGRDELLCKISIPLGILPSADLIG